MAVVGAFGTKENAYVRQVLGYWEMVASLIVHGTLNAALAEDTLGRDVLRVRQGTALR